MPGPFIDLQKPDSVARDKNDRDMWKQDIITCVPGVIKRPLQICIEELRG